MISLPGELPNCGDEIAGSLGAEATSKIFQAVGRLEERLQALDRSCEEQQLRLQRLAQSHDLQFQLILGELQRLNCTALSQYPSDTHGPAAEVCGRSLAPQQCTLPQGLRQGPAGAVMHSAPQDHDSMQRAWEPEQPARRAAAMSYSPAGPLAEATEVETGSYDGVGSSEASDNSFEGLVKVMSGRLKYGEAADATDAGPHEGAETHMGDMKERAFCWENVTQPLHPEGQVRLRWDMLTLLLLLYICITSPVIVCFNVQLTQNDVMWYIELVVTLLFCFDILINFNTGFFDQCDRLMTNRLQIAWNYSSTWMLIDILAIFPFELIPGASGTDMEGVQLVKSLRLAKFTRILRVLRVVKLLRILKVFKLPQLMKQLTTLAGANVLRMSTVIGSSFLLLHLMACGYYYAAFLYHEDILLLEASDPSWARMSAEERHERVIVSWDSTWVGYSNLAEAGGVNRYITALYWSIYTMTTCGYGDIVPQNTGERVLCMVAQLIGVSLFAYFMGKTASLIAAVNSSETAVSQRVMQMKEFLQKRHVPRGLRDKIDKFYSLAARHQAMDVEHIVAGLSAPLRTELLLFLYQGTLEKVPFLKNRNPQFITSLVSRLHVEYYAEGDIVVAEGDLGNTMYFIVNGTLESRQYAAAEDEDWIANIGRAVTKMHHETRRAGMSFFKRIKRKYVDDFSQKLTGRKRVELDFVYPHAEDLGNNYSVSATLTDGQHFGELSCLLEQPRSTTVVALDFCEVYGLSREDLMDVYREWPELHQEFLRLVAELEAMMGSSSLAPSSYPVMGGRKKRTSSNGGASPQSPGLQRSFSVGMTGSRAAFAKQGASMASAPSPGGNFMRQSFDGATRFRPPTVGALASPSNDPFSAASDTGPLSAGRLSSPGDHSSEWGIVAGGGVGSTEGTKGDLGGTLEVKPALTAVKSFRGLSRRRLKDKARLVMNMQRLAEKKNNPVFHLLSNGNDMKTLLSSDEAEATTAQPPPSLAAGPDGLPSVPMVNRAISDVAEEPEPSGGSGSSSSSPLLAGQRTHQEGEPESGGTSGVN